MCIQGCFYYRGKKHRLTLKDDSLSWEPEGMPDLSQNVLLSEIVCCWLCPRGSLSCYPDEGSDRYVKECPHRKKESGGGLSIEICGRRDGRKWGTAVFVFLHAAREILLTWHDALWSVINGLTERPRCLLVVINPVGGKKKADPIFEKKVAPLFRRARISTTKVKTDYRGHGTILVQEASDAGLLKECDGIVAVGGDGLVNEIATGLFILAAENHSLDPHDPETDLPVTGYRLGIIPSGSTDATCFATNGTSDPVTAAIHIIMGDRRGVDVAAVHTDNELKRIVTTLVSYGYFGDLIRSSEQYRCIGPPRYILSGAQQIFRNRSYSVNIEVRRGMKNSGVNNVSCSSITSSVSCTSMCSVCNYVDDTKNLIQDSPSEHGEWKEISGKFSVVSAAITSCACRLTPQGVSPSAHLGDGHTDLILVNGSSRWKLLRYLYHTSVTGNAVDLGHVQMIRTNEIRFRAAPNGTTSCWNCDGEELHALSLTLKVHRQKLQLFCRGIEDPIPSTIHKRKNTL